MKKCALISIITIALVLLISSSAFACDEKQTDTYVTQILFGDNAQSKASDDNVKKLQAALYLCSEQYGKNGQEKIDYLKEQKVTGVPDLETIAIEHDYLMRCSHSTWESELPEVEKEQVKRRKVLQNTVNDALDFGFFKSVFGRGGNKCESFAALLYYSHILADYLADDPNDTKVVVNGKLVPAYSGKPFKIINGDKPSFTKKERKSTHSTINISKLDEQGRATGAFANIGQDIMPGSNSRDSIQNIKPSGWNQKEYKTIIGTKNTPHDLYNRSHLIAHELIGGDVDRNLITGTEYLNKKSMRDVEERVANYIKKTNNHVLYKATPYFKGDNKLASGIQIEAYSVEDSGKGICENRYYYNVQPGIHLKYSNGKNYKSDKIINEKGVLPFATSGGGEDNPDLIYEVNKHLEILFDDQKDSGKYDEMMNEIKTIASKARGVSNNEGMDADKYLELKTYEYEYLDVLKKHVPQLLMKEDSFTSAFN